MNNETDLTYFGFKKVEEAQKSTLVSKLFSDVSSKYDLMNDIMSCGMQRIWKKKFIEEILSFVSGIENPKILDVASGTGDIGIKLFQKLQGLSIESTMFLTDINQDMLSIAMNKSIDANILKNMHFYCVNAELLAFPDKIFDCYTIAFGIRNVSAIKKALSESYRVLKDGGKFFCMELSLPEHRIFRGIYDLYSMNVIPKIGKYVANNEDAYRYLVESIRTFPNRDEFSDMIEYAGYSNVSYSELTSGIVTVYTAYKL